jgi:putative Mn2+ efflux pump MntP
MILKLLALIIPLCIDTFAVSAALGMSAITVKRKLLISIFFTIFEAGMPLLGLLAGAPLHRVFGNKASYVAYAILILFGVYTLLRRKDNEDDVAKSILNSWGISAILLGLSISIDEVAIGLTLGLLNFPIVPVITAIAVQAFLFSQAGFWLGKRLSEKFRENAESLAGIVLILVGIVLYVGHS